MGNYNWAKKAGLTSVSLQKMYKELTDGEIAKKFGVTDVAVSKQRKRWGVPTITPRQRRERQQDSVLSLDDLIPTELASLYQQMGDRQIGALYGVSKSPIAALRRKWGIKSISKSERSTVKVPLTNEQKELCIGTILGDGHLLQRGALQVSHGHDQIGYLRHLHSVLSPHVSPIFYVEKTLKSGQVCFSFGFRTDQHTWLKELRKVFYPAGVRTFPQPVLERLTPRSLAYWYFDDGHLEGGVPSFALGDISTIEADRVIESVGRRFGLDTWPKSAAGNCKILGIRASSADIFFHLIRTYATPDMLYKLPQKHWPTGISPSMPCRTVVEGMQLPKDLQSQCKKWAGLTEDEQKGLLGDLIAFWRGAGFPYQESRPEEIVALLNLDQNHVLQDGVLKNRMVGQATCHAFASHIWEATPYKGGKSPVEIFNDDDLLRGALRFSLNMKRVPTRGNLRSALRFWRHSGVYNFRPAVAKALVDRYCRTGGVVWDPCAGYGGRLLGTVLSRASPTYVACEPNPETCARLPNLVKWLEGYVPGVAARVNLHRVPAEEFDPPRVDMVMTSPPYWKKETYGDSPLLAGNRYPTYDSWLQGFWRVVLEKAVQALNPGGWIVVNVDDFVIDKVNHPLIRDTLDIGEALNLGVPEKWKYAVPTLGDSGNHEMVICWVKMGACPESELPEASVVNLSRCVSCGKLAGNLAVDGKCKECSTPKGVLKPCKGCGHEFRAQRKNQEFHDKACHGRWRRREYRKTHPARTTRMFTCDVCGKDWETSKRGRFKYCPECQEKKELAKRTKECAYRHCRREFVDTSPRNSMNYCLPEHRRREKMFRSGKVTSVEDFKKPDPVDLLS